MELNKVETAWLIETKFTNDGPPRWFEGYFHKDGRIGGEYTGFTQESLQAIRFSRKVDAERLIQTDSRLWPLGCTATEHSWG